MKPLFKKNLVLTVAIASFLLFSYFIYLNRKTLFNKEKWETVNQDDQTWEVSWETYNKSKIDDRIVFYSNQNSKITFRNNFKQVKYFPDSIFKVSYSKTIQVKNFKDRDKIRIGIKYPLGFGLEINNKTLLLSPNIYSLDKDSISFILDHNINEFKTMEWFVFSTTNLKEDKLSIRLSFYSHNSTLNMDLSDFVIEVNKQGYFFAPFKLNNTKISNNLKSDIPKIEVFSESSTIPDEPKIKGKIKITLNNKPVNLFNIKIEKRGHSTQFFQQEKHSYSFTLYDNEWNKTEINLLGLLPDSKWVLYGPYFDKSLIRNALTYEIGNFMDWYSPSVEKCELFINNKYKGVYYLIEKIDKNKSKINFEKDKGFLAQMNRPKEKEYGFYLKQNKSSINYISIIYPSEKKLKSTDENLIKSQIFNIDSIFNYTEYLVNPWDYIDIQSFVNYFIINELSRNIDAYRLSTYMFNKDYKNAGSKLYIGPIWDFNNAYGNCLDATDYKGWAFNLGNEFAPYIMVNWWENAFFKNNEFKRLLKSTWSNYRNSFLSDEQVLLMIDSLSSYGNEANIRNFEVHNILDQNLWWNSYAGTEYKNEIFFLKCWIVNRLHWMDYAINKPNYISNNSLY